MITRLLSISNPKQFFKLKEKEKKTETLATA